MSILGDLLKRASPIEMAKIAKNENIKRLCLSTKVNIAMLPMADYSITDAMAASIQNDISLDEYTSLCEAVAEIINGTTNVNVNVPPAITATTVSTKEPIIIQGANEPPPWEEQPLTNKGEEVKPDIVIIDDPALKSQQPPAPQDAFGMMLESMINTKLAGIETGIDEKVMQQAIKTELKKHVKTIKLIPPGSTEPVKIDSPHESFEEMMHWINAGENVMLSGPAGSGKTTAGKLASEALNRRFGSISLSNDTRAYALFGFTNGQSYTTTEFRELYENGGVFVLDEVDNGQANILSKLNSALENGRYAFDDKVVERHPEFVCISTANTWGHGGDREYVGRNALDAAFLDRFIKIDWGYDEKLERLIAPNEDFTRKIQKIRKTAKELKYKIVVSPRASIRGGKMLDANITGMTERKILDAVLWRGVAKNIKDKIMANIS